MVSEKEKQLETALKEAQSILRITSNTVRLLNEQSFPGNIAYQVVEGISFLSHVQSQAKSTEEQLKDLLRDEKKNSKSGVKAQDDVAKEEVQNVVQTS